MELPRGGRHGSVPQAPNLVNPTDAFVQAAESVIGGTVEAASELTRDVDALDSDAEKGWMFEREAPEDEACLHQI
jgi:hypothetical protein